MLFPEKATAIRKDVTTIEYKGIQYENNFNQEQSLKVHDESELFDNNDDKKEKDELKDDNFLNVIGVMDHGANHKTEDGNSADLNKK